MANLSQLTFIPTNWAQHVRPFQYTVEELEGFGQVPASAPFIACPLLTDIDENYNLLSEKIRGDNSGTYYKHAYLGNRYGLSTKHCLFDETFLNLCTKKPDPDNPEDNLASSLALYRSYKRAVGAFAVTEHEMGYMGCRAESVALGLSVDSRITCDIGWNIREIKGPVAALPQAGGGLGWTTPVLVADFTGYTAVPKTHIQAGKASFSYNGTSYVIESMNVTWTNTLNSKAYPGSNLIDTNQVVNQDIKVDVVIIEGKDLVFEAACEASAIVLQDGIQKLDTGASPLKINIGGMSIESATVSQSAEGGEEFKRSLTFDCVSADFSTTP